MFDKTHTKYQRLFLSLEHSQLSHYRDSFKGIVMGLPSWQYLNESRKTCDEKAFTLLCNLNPLLFSLIQNNEVKSAYRTGNAPVNVNNVGESYRMVEVIDR